MRRFFFLLMISALFFFVVNANIRAALMPCAYFFGALLNTAFVFTGNGYKEINGLFEITKDCLGVNLTLCYFFLFGIFSKKFPKGFVKEILMLLKYLFYSAAAAFFVTLLRICLSLPFVQSGSFRLLHNIISLIIYFISIMILYEFLRRGRNDKAFGN